MTVVPVTSADIDAAEVSWFSALCSDDYAYLGVPDGSLRSSWEHCSDIVKKAEELGFRNILCPSSYQVGQDTLSFVAGCAPISDRINFLAAIRCGEMQPIMLARTVATLDHMLKGRLTLNVISSDFPGEVADSAYRYKRSHEVVQILRQAWTRDTIDHDGEIYQFKGISTDPARPYQQNGGPLLYFGGYSPDALELCGAQCDVYLMWPETKDQLADRMRAANAHAAAHGRTLDYGLRVHMVVRDTERKRGNTPITSSLNSMTSTGSLFAIAHTTADRLVSRIRRAPANLQTSLVTSNPICGLASDAPVPVAVLHS